MVNPLLKMTTKYFLDTCIWRDFYEDRFGKTGRPLGKYASNLFMKILKNKDKIVFSETLFWEMKKDYSEREINEMLNFLDLCKVLTKINIKKEEFQEAKKLSNNINIPLVDCINAIQARNHKAIMISQDMHFLKDLNDITNTKKPEEIN